MKRLGPRILLVLGLCAAAAACGPSRDGDATPVSVSVDPELRTYIGKIRAVDNHTHANTVDPDDSEYDALPIEVLLPFEIPARLRPDSPDWLAAYRALYDFPDTELREERMPELREAMRRVADEQGDGFPEWVLDRIGTEVMLANRIAMGPGLAPPRFRWVSYVDALLLPLSTRLEAAESPDREKLYPIEERHLRRYMAEQGVDELPPTLDGYLDTVVTPTLESQSEQGCLAVKFEVAYLRSLDFGNPSAADAAEVYSRYVKGGEPSHAEYKALQDFLFRHIAREAGRLGMAVHIHSFHGAGGFYRAAGSDPLLLESVFNDPTLRETSFVLVHGGGAWAAHTGAMLWKPNVYADISALTWIHSPGRLADVLKDWLDQFPEKVLFGSDAAAFGPDAGWELGAWIATDTGRQALAIALTSMMRDDGLSRSRAEEIATMVLRTNAARLYGLPLQ